MSIIISPRIFYSICKLVLTNLPYICKVLRFQDRSSGVMSAVCGSGTWNCDNNLSQEASVVQVGLNVTLFIQIVQFLIILLIVNFLIVKPVHTTILKREQKIGSLKNKASASLAAIEQKAQEYENRLKATRAEITEYKNQLHADAQTKSQAMIDKAKAENNAELAAARKQIATEANIARETLKAETGELTKQIIQMVTK